MEELTQQALVVIIVNFCKVKKDNIDTPKVTKCVEYMTNCSVSEQGIIYKVVVDQCRKSYKE